MPTKNIPNFPEFVKAVDAMFVSLGREIVEFHAAEYAMTRIIQELRDKRAVTPEIDAIFSRYTDYRQEAVSAALLKIEDEMPRLAVDLDSAGEETS